MSKNRIAIVHDWFMEYAGSERCVESFTNIWPEADIYTLIEFIEGNAKKVIFKNKKPITSFIQKMPFAKSRYRNYLPLFPKAIESFDLSGYDIVFSSSHAVAKGAKTNKAQLHICYCHTPIRYAWDLKDQYLTEAGLDKGLKSLLAKSVLKYIRNWDLKTSNRPDFMIANSRHIAERIKRIYNRDSVVIYPPVDVEKFSVAKDRDDYYLTASRFVPYKKIDMIVEAFSQMPDKKLFVIGKGPEEDKIKSKAKQNIEFLGFLESDSLKGYMQKAKAFVFAANEDFGIVVVEAMACGTPVIAWNFGGVSETVLDSKTGVLYPEQNVKSLIAAVGRFEKMKDSFDHHRIRDHSIQFSRKIFEEKISKFVWEKSKVFFKNN